MKLWTKIGCMLTGWDYKLMSNSSVSSRSKLTKYTSALLILILLWSITGYCLASRFFGLSLVGSIAVSFFFVAVIIMIERQIILASEKTMLTLIFRSFIAIVMAIVGSTIIDQSMFSKDINKEMQERIEEQTQALVPMRGSVIDESLLSLSHEIDSLNNVNAELQADIDKHPFIPRTSVSTVTETKEVGGRLVKVKTPTVTTVQEPNPKNDQEKSNKTRIESLDNQKQKLIDKKQTLEEDIRNECKANVGFLEELEAMWEIITTRPMAGGFYIVLFALLVSLELFILANKFGDKDCDYELAVKRSEEFRIKMLNSNSHLQNRA